MRRVLTAVLAVTICSCGGGGFSSEEERDVSGNYAITYDDQLTFKLYAGGAVREVTATGYGNVIDFGTVEGQPARVDLTQFCAKPEVQCPSEAFWPKVAITQPELKSNRLDLQKVLVVNDSFTRADGGVVGADGGVMLAPSLGGLVNHDDFDKFLLGLGADGASNANCLALSVSLAGGRFSRAGERIETSMEFRTMAGKACSLDAGVADAGTSDGGAASDAGSNLLADGGVDCVLTPVQKFVVPPGAKVDGIKDGKVFMGWAGGCAFGPFLAGAVLTVETGFTGRRTGEFDAPVFKAAPVVLPADGGVDAGVADGGADAGP
jgi:hypothetical protein